MKAWRVVAFLAVGPFFGCARTGDDTPPADDAPSLEGTYVASAPGAPGSIASVAFLPNHRYALARVPADASEISEDAETGTYASNEAQGQLRLTSDDGTVTTMDFVAPPLLHPQNQVWYAQGQPIIQEPRATQLVVQGVQLVRAASSYCDLPFTKMVDKNTGAPFALKDAVNTNSRISETANKLYNYKNRFLVLNLDTRDESGQCKGLVENYPRVSESSPPVDQYPELKDSATLSHFVHEVQDPNYQTPANKRSVVSVAGKAYCIGQTASLCEIRGAQVVEIARLGTSSLNRDSAPERSRTYGEYNQINTKKWMAGRDYTAADGVRDEALGGIDSSTSRGVSYTRYTAAGGMILNNFMKWDGLRGYEVPSFFGGLHELSVGETNVNNLGAPVSHGCLRLTRYGSIFARWWTPLGAKMFVQYTTAGYRQSP
jgi:hypothetical protein